jgi:amino acid permease
MRGGYASIPGSGESSRAAAGRSRRMREGGGNATKISSCINIMNTLLGAGILAMPFVLSQMGIIFGIFVILWSATASGFGLYLQSRCARYLDRGTSSFYAIAQLTYPNAAVILDSAIVIKCFGVGVSYLIIIGDLMPGVMAGLSDNWADDSCLLNRGFWITLFMIPVMVLSFMKKLDSLKYTSLLALLAIGYLFGLVIVNAIMHPLPDLSQIRVLSWAGPVAALRVFPVVVFAYTCHQNMFSVLNEIKNDSPSTVIGVIGNSIGGAFGLYFFISIAGYLTFGNDVKGNIVSQYPTNGWSTFGKACIVVLELFSVPLQVHPCRASLDTVLRFRFAKTGADRGRSVSPGGRPLLTGGPAPRADHAPTPMSELRFALITTLILVASYITAMYVKSLDSVLAYVGATGSTSISFILPGLFYYKISDPDSIHHQRLLKDDDDADEDIESSGAGPSEPIATPAIGSLLGNLGPDAQAAAPARVRWHQRLGNLHPENIEPKLLRKLSYALVVYGFVVMSVCVIMNTIFAIKGH